MVATYTPTNFATQDPTTYKSAIDGNGQVAKRVVDSYAPHAQSSPNMTIALDAGFVWDGATLTEVAAQNTGTITAPVTFPRIDRVVVDNSTGAVSVITGTPGASPVAPTITVGTSPVAQITVQTSSTSITNGMITDERALGKIGGTLAPIIITMTPDTTPDAGNLMMNGQTIAKTSGANYNGIVYQRLYVKIWNCYDNTAAPVSGGSRGANALADFNANKNIGIPDRRGYTPYGAWASGLITTASGVFGADTVAAAGSVSGSTSFNSITPTASTSAVLSYSVDVSNASAGVTNTLGGGADPSNHVGTSTTQVSTNAGGGSITPSGTWSGGFTGSGTSVMQKSFGVYYQINYL